MKELVSAVEERVTAAEQCLRGVDVSQLEGAEMDRLFTTFHAPDRTFDEYSV
jgi:hypothetical protein